jgi:SnoaL-like domain
VQAKSDTEQVVSFYTEAWRRHDPAAVRQIIAPDADIEWNLDAPVDDEQLVQVLDRLAAYSRSIILTSEIYAEDRAALVYDCNGVFGTARIAEFIHVEEGRIAEVRQVHDATAIRRYFPNLLDDLA